MSEMQRPERTIAERVQKLKEWFKVIESTGGLEAEAFVAEAEGEADIISEDATRLEGQLARRTQERDDSDMTNNSLHEIIQAMTDCGDCQAVEAIKAENAALTSRLKDAETLVTAVKDLYTYNHGAIGSDIDEALSAFTKGAGK